MEKALEFFSDFHNKTSDFKDWFTSVIFYKGICHYKLNKPIPDDFANNLTNLES